MRLPWPPPISLNALMRGVAGLAFGASFVGFIGFLDALYTHVVATQQSGTTVGIFGTVIFAAHGAALLFSIGFNHFGGFGDAPSVGGFALPRRGIGFAVE